MVYLFHFYQPVGGRAHHYCGYSESWRADERLEQHLNGSGAKIMKAAVEQQVDWIIGRMWPHGDRTFERDLKNLKNFKFICPICNPEGWQKHGAKAYEQALERRAERMQKGLKRMPIKRSGVLSIGFFGVPGNGYGTKTHIVDLKGRPICGSRLHHLNEFQACSSFVVRDVAQRHMAAECRRCEKSLEKIRQTLKIKTS
jgi:predicted GIY-YIG superfamily endonuclease